MQFLDLPLRSREAITIRIDYPSIRKHIDLDDIFLDGYCIIKITLTIDELL